VYKKDDGKAKLLPICKLYLYIFLISAHMYDHVLIVKESNCSYIEKITLSGWYKYMIPNY
jgi:hypothetical protein